MALPYDPDRAIAAARTDRLWQAYFCLVPVFGVVPAALILVGNRGDRQLQNTARLAIGLLAVWLVGTALLTGDSTAIALGKGTLGSAYFALCLGAMARLYARRRR
ncbi:MAG: hypothetical protein HC918_12145 [Oscillatoriales cyanobacterium SM2_1_8]|nr:hypothetical protein [Oscillatoriales cyanobacterium SM2_1_8]